MKKVILFIGIIMSFNGIAQSKYQQGMRNAFQLWETGKMIESSQLFERISKAEKDNWLPAYYAAYTEVLSSFNIKEESKLTAKLNRAQELLDAATSVSENNPEIIIVQALLNTTYIAFDGQKYGMTLSGKNRQLYSKALEIDPKNPRVLLGFAEWNMGTAQFFGQSTKPYCEQIEKAIEIGKKEEITTEFYPKFQLKRAQEVLKKCKS